MGATSLPLAYQPLSALRARHSAARHVAEGTERSGAERNGSVGQPFTLLPPTHRHQRRPPARHARRTERHSSHPARVRARRRGGSHTLGHTGGIEAGNSSAESGKVIPSGEREPRGDDDGLWQQGRRQRAEPAAVTFGIYFVRWERKNKQTNRARRDLLAHQHACEKRSRCATEHVPRINYTKIRGSE